MKRNWKLLITTSFTLVSLVWTSGCGKNNGGGGGGGIYNPYSIGAGGIQQPTTLVTGTQSQTASGDTFTLDILAPALSVQQYSYFGPNAAVYYNGQVAVQGTLTVSSYSPSLSTCGLTAGTYPVTTLQAGTMANQTMSNVILQVQVTGGILSIPVTSGFLVLSNPIKLMLNTAALTVNGYPCSYGLTTF